MPNNRVTLIVSPRERFSAALASLDDIYRNTDFPFDLVYVDSASPPAIAQGLEQRSQKHGFQLLRSACYLSPNEARTFGLQHAPGEYVVFIDNDIMVRPGWLMALVNCAEETGAWVVCPTICWGSLVAGQPDFERIHFAGGTAVIQEQEGVNRLKEDNAYFDCSLSQLQNQLKRRPCSLAEFHCMLVRRNNLGPALVPDLHLYSTREQIDFSMSITRAGGSIYHEPAAVISYVLTPTFTWPDRLYYLLRWSEAWNQSTLEHLNRKWQLNDDYAEFRQLWLRPHRELALRDLRHRCRQLIGSYGDCIVDKLEHAIAQRGLQQRAKVGLPSALMQA